MFKQLQKKEKLLPFSIRITEVQMKTVKKLAKKYNCSKNDVLKSLVQAGIDSID